MKPGAIYRHLISTNQVVIDKIKSERKGKKNVVTERPKRA